MSSKQEFKVLLVRRANPKLGNNQINANNCGTEGKTHNWEMVTRLVVIDWQELQKGN